jgi:LCP family protein required for cell wall assembly
MILVSVDFVHSKIKLTSFLRDSWVEIPSKGKKAKLNSACSYGGPQLVVDTIEYNFGVDIDHYVMVDFNMFTEIIDNLGGVDVEVTSKEAKFINNTTRHTVESGEKVHLNGAEALVYCRIRKLDSDYMRTYRQRKVITALINQAKSAGLSTLISTMQEVFPLIKTDMSAAEITGLAYKAGIGLVAFDIEQNRVPIDEHMKATTVNGQWVETLELDNVREYLHDYIYTNKIKLDEEK